VRTVIVETNATHIIEDFPKMICSVSPRSQRTNQQINIMVQQVGINSLLHGKLKQLN
jgi:hypothetical protein